MAFPATSRRPKPCRKCWRELSTPLESVVLLNLDLGILFKRLTGRRICQDCGKVFNVYTSPPRRRAKHRLIQRPDDKEEVIGKRLEVYEAQTKPLIKYYEAAGLLRVVDADADVNTVFKSIEHAVFKPTSNTSSSDSLEQSRPDFLPPPAGEGMRVAHRVRAAHGKRLELAARREYFGADVEFRGARIDDFGQALDHRLLCGSRARVLAGFLVVRIVGDDLAARPRGLLQGVVRAAARGLAQRQKSRCRRVSRRAADRGSARVFRAKRRWLWRGRAGLGGSCAMPRSRTQAWAGSGSYSRDPRGSGNPPRPSVRARARCSRSGEVMRRCRRDTGHRPRRIPIVPATAAASTSRCGFGPWGCSHRAMS